METVTDYFLWLQNHCRWWLQPWNQKMLAPWKKSYDNSRQHIKKQRHYFADKGAYIQRHSFYSSHVWMWELGHKKVECWRIDAFELQCWRRVLRVPWTARRSNKSILKEINSEYSLKELMLKLKLQYSGHLIWRANTLEKTQHIGKDPDTGKDWGQEEKGVTEDEMVGWHHQINGHEFEQTLGDREGQTSLVCCGSWSCKELDTS